MHTHRFPAPATFFFIIIAITLVQFPVPSVHAVDDKLYLNCSETFECAGLSGLGYPFLGSNRPEYCGYPGFELNCSVDPPQLNVADMYYRVLEINSAARSLKVARVDYWDTTCPATYANTTIDRSTLFSHDTSATTNLTLYYQCPATFSVLLTQPADGFSFTCAGDPNDSFINYYSTSSNASRINYFLGSSAYNVKVPVMQSVVESSTLTTEDAVREAINRGFTVGWNANNSMCDRCDGSGGRCGFTTSTNAFACDCKTGSFPSTCGSDIGLHMKKRMGMLYVERLTKQKENAKKRDMKTLHKCTAAYKEHHAENKLMKSTMQQKKSAKHWHRKVKQQKRSMGRHANLKAALIMHKK